MKELLKTWRLRMVKYRQEADNAKSPITRLKAMNKFFVYRDCIKELEQAINDTRCCKSDSELLCDKNEYGQIKKLYIRVGNEWVEQKKQ